MYSTAFCQLFVQEPGRTDPPPDVMLCMQDTSMAADRHYLLNHRQTTRTTFATASKPSQVLKLAWLHELWYMSSHRALRSTRFIDFARERSTTCHQGHTCNLTDWTVGNRGKHEKKKKNHTDDLIKEKLHENVRQQRCQEGLWHA